jgi:FtsP/CotA-like multicopper oxidase with cupredoxin domain
MDKKTTSRRGFLRVAGAVMCAMAPRPGASMALGLPKMFQPSDLRAPDYVLDIGPSPIEIAPKKIVSTITYNGQFPGPLLRFKEGQPVNIEVHNNTDTPEQLHWHGQMLSTDVDGAAQEGTPFIPARGMRRIAFTPRPSGFRFYHTHNRAGADLHAGQYSGQVGPVYIEPKDDPGSYDKEVFLVLKEFEPTFSQGGDMAQNFLAPSAKSNELEASGESSMKASLAKGMPRGYEVGYRYFTINGRMLGHGEPLRVKLGQRVLFHVLNGSATEIRSLGLPGHSFQVLALDGNSIMMPVEVPVLWLGTAERISAIVEMNHPGIWILGDVADDDRALGMGIVVEYAGHQGKPIWVPPKPFRWNYSHFAKTGAAALAPEETLEMTFAKENAAEEGFSRWTINGTAYPMTQGIAPASFHLKQGKRYRLRMRNASDDIHPVHLHRHSFELNKVAGISCAGVMKDVVMVGGYQEVEVDFTADNPGLTLFHCHQQLHMDFGFMALFDYV